MPVIRSLIHGQWLDFYLNFIFAEIGVERWRAARARLAQRRHPRILGRRFRQDPDAYLQALEESLVQLSLPP